MSNNPNGQQNPAYAAIPPTHRNGEAWEPPISQPPVAAYQPQAAPVSAVDPNHVLKLAATPTTEDVPTFNLDGLTWGDEQNLMYLQADLIDAARGGNSAEMRRLMGIAGAYIRRHTTHIPRSWLTTNAPEGDAWIALDGGLEAYLRRGCYSQLNAAFLGAVRDDEKK